MIFPSRRMTQLPPWAGAPTAGALPGAFRGTSRRVTGRQVRSAQALRRASGKKTSLIGSLRVTHVSRSPFSEFLYAIWRFAMICRLVGSQGVNHMWESHAAEAPRKLRIVIVLSRGGEESIAETMDASCEPHGKYVIQPRSARMGEILKLKRRSD